MVFPFTKWMPVSGITRREARTVRLMTNNPKKYTALSGFGMEIVDRVPLEIPPTDSSRAYLETKKHKMGHILKLV